jgi:hypothetical protein
MEGIGRLHLLLVKGRRPAKLYLRSPAATHNSFAADFEHLIEFIHQGD